jgi:hypothetical protein
VKRTRPPQRPTRKHLGSDLTCRLAGKSPPAKIALSVPVPGGTLALSRSTIDRAHEA